MPKLNPYIVTTASRVTAQAATFLAMLVAVRNVSPSDFGAFAVPWAVTVICNGTLYNGFFQHLLRVRDLNTARDTDFWLLAAEGALFALSMVFTSFILRHSESREMARAFLLLSPAVMLGAIAAWNEALLTRANRIETCALSQLLAELAGLSALLFGALNGAGVDALIAWRLIGAVVGTALLACSTRAVPRLAFDREEAKRGLTEALPLQGSALTGTAAVYAADFLLAAFLSPAATGNYRVATRFSAAAGNIFLDPLRSVTWLTLSDAERRGDDSSMQGVLLKQVQLVALLSWPVLIGLAQFGARLFPIITDKDWGGAGPLLQLLALARLTDVMSFFLDPVLVCRNKQRLRFNFRTIAIIVNVIGIALTSPFGVTHVAQWQLIYGVATGICSIYLIAHYLRLAARQLASALAPACASTLLCLVVGELVYQCTAFITPKLQLGTTVLAVGAAALIFTAWLHGRGILSLPKLDHQPSVKSSDTKRSATSATT